MTRKRQNKETGKFRVRRWFPSRTRRGYGIHSPFAYSVIRYVFGPDSGGIRGALFDTLSGSGIRRKTAARIERLYRMCGCENIATDRLRTDADPRRTLFLFSAAGAEDTPALKAAAGDGGGILCMLNPRKGRLWRELCRQIAEGHDGMGIESRSLMIIFKDKGLNKQHIRV